MKLSSGIFSGRLFLLLPLLTSWLSLYVLADVYLQEKFSDDTWEKRWLQSKHKDDLGAFKVSPGKFYADEIESRGLQTSQHARFYAISAKLDTPIDNTEKNLVVQFSVKHEQNIDCGGGYVKLLPPTFDQADFRGDSEYNIMFGPDICGDSRKVHFIIHHDGENKLIKKKITAPSDQLTHLYTLIIKPDQTYTVLIDSKEEQSGKLEEDFEFTPKLIDDPEAKKPDDWVDTATIEDSTDKKPDDWVDGPELIDDPDATKPEDWDDEMNGDWEPPQIANPEYKGVWKPRHIPNPDYKGEWKAPLIPNPDYKEDPLLHAFNTAYIGFDLWQVKSGTIFDNILITDDTEYAEKFANETFVEYREAERDAKKKLDEIESKKFETDVGGKKEENEDEKEEEEEKDKGKKEDKSSKVEVPLPDEKVPEKSDEPPASSKQEDDDEFDKLFADFEHEEL
ncbi:5612_t:CDS:2 [Ambispora leptoticha]|uniref:Calreticulin n=1 Tax=Ambispora leptoticha TaxID=144679 RepID=A0A9N8WST5_9GLOM|nr:5612_t:CDS:2 [Ambispora leptoticha]